MSDHLKKVGRRHFLMGAGGAMAIPFLPSMERTAYAGGSTPSVLPRWFMVSTDHGACYETNYFPQNQVSFTTANLGFTGEPGHTIRSAQLAPLLQSGNDSRVGVSNVIRASAQSLSAKLLAKLNLLQGLDYPFSNGHSQGLRLGNYANNNALGQAGQEGNDAAQVYGMVPTIDQVMAHAKNFYGATPVMPNLPIGGAYSGSSKCLSWANGPGGAWNKETNLAVASYNSNSSLAIFNSMFANFGSNTEAKPRTSPVATMASAYNSLQSSPRISRADSLRLQQHYESLLQVESSLSATLGCTTLPPMPADNTDYRVDTPGWNGKLWGQAYMDLIAAAFQCDATRVATLAFGDTSWFSPSYLSLNNIKLWHQYVAHQWCLTAAAAQQLRGLKPQDILVESYQGFFEQIFLYLANKLDGMIDADGNTVLDNSLLVWQQECSMETHAGTGIQTATFGSAGGKLKTGMYNDYRHTSSASKRLGFKGVNSDEQSVDAEVVSYYSYPGLLMDQFFATNLQVMGVDPSAWAFLTDSTGKPTPGYGAPFVSPGNYTMNYAPHYAPGVSGFVAPRAVTLTEAPYHANAGSLLPFLT